mmetsp:Transcript_16907/g.41902  ORF Transcript_16907/g.41902 Transcript_16907/m.41902 type:complete len:204 (+) Transcript_16907:210-821(+)
MLGVIPDIVVTDTSINKIQIKVRSRFAPNWSHDITISAIQTPISPNPAVEAPTASLKGSSMTEMRFPITPHITYRERILDLPNCFSIPKPIRSWKNTLKNRCIMLAWSIIGQTSRQSCPRARAGPQLAPRRYNAQGVGFAFWCPTHMVNAKAAIWARVTFQMKVSPSNPGKISSMNCSSSFGCPFAFVSAHERSLPGPGTVAI